MSESRERPREVSAGGRVDEINRSFYNQFTFPPPPPSFERLKDAYFEVQMLNQSLGGWCGDRVARRPRIWVAGCGKYQAIQTALRFPAGEVLATDLADRSLMECRRVARQLGVDNLVVREESIFDARYADEFDYVLCIGVLHHLAAPPAALRLLAQALRPLGVLELMVYNRYHRSASIAFQAALRVLCRDVGEDFGLALRVAKKMVAEYPPNDRLSQFVRIAESDALFADTFLQPVENTYTVASLAAMAGDCGLELLHPRSADWDKSWNAGRPWSLAFQDEELRSRYSQLGDVERWQVTNLVLGEDSPLLWFYLQRVEVGPPRRSERELCADFLRGVFERRTTTVTKFLRHDDGVYRPGAEVEHPGPPVNEESRRVWAAVDGEVSMEELLLRLGIARDDETINRLRLRLTTPPYPYLSFCGWAAGAVSQPRERPEPGRLGSVTRRPLTWRREERG